MLTHTASIGNQHCLSDITVAPVAPTWIFSTRGSRNVLPISLLALCLAPSGSSLCGFSSGTLSVQTPLDLMEVMILPFFYFVNPILQFFKKKFQNRSFWYRFMQKLQ